MKNSKKTKELSVRRVRRLRAQGYLDQTASELSDIALGHRFAFKLCFLVSAIATYTASIPVLSIMMIIAILGVVLPYHPFDYIYNHLVRKWINKPVLPPRPMQLKFSCVLAIPWIGTTAYLFFAGHVVAAQIIGWMLVMSAFLVGFIDLCIPSMIYNSIFRLKVRQESLTLQSQKVE